MGIEVYFIMAFIGIITYFFWKWLFTRAVKDPKKRNIAIWVSTIVGTPILYLLIIISIFAAMSYYPEHDFDSVKWKNDSEKRYELTEDLIDSKMLIGKSPKEVEYLLGKADGIYNNIWVYDVGFVPALANIDPDIVEITFRNNKVASITQRGT
jgi:hypothetical protein